MSRAAGALLLIAWWAAPAAAQPFERVVDPLPVTEDGAPLPFAFYGGLAAPRVQLADADVDGDLDLFLQDAPDLLTLFENVGSATAPRYRWRTDQYGGLVVGQWARLADLDGDGDLDVLAEEPFSRVRYYRNEGPPGAARFTLAADTLRAFVRPEDGAPRDTVLAVDRQNTPALADLDCDGLADLLTATVEQGTLILYAGAEPEAGLPRFRFVSSAYDSLQIIGFGKRREGARHGASALAVGDVDGDGDPDLLWGDFFSTSLYYIENVGRCGAPDLERRADVFPDGFRTSGYNAPHLADEDGDGDLDLLVGVLSGTSGTSPNASAPLLFFERTAAGYVRRPGHYLPMIDVGVAAAPALGDVDGDGALDLVIGNEIDPADPTTGVLRRALRDGAALRLEADAFAPAAGYNLTPALGDLDADGDPDLVMGTFGGRVVHARNDDGAFTLAADPLVSIRDRALGISGSASTPALGDLDGDGDLDLLVGEASGALNLFRNDGTPAAPRFVFVTDAYLVVPGTRAAPALGDLDGDGDPDLVVGTEAGVLHVFRNDGAPGASAFVEAERTAVPAFRGLVPTLGDGDADGDLDLVVGTAAGGLLYLRNDRVATARETASPPAPSATVAPNPSLEAAVLRFVLDRPGRVTVDVYDPLGRRVARVGGGVLGVGPQAVELGGGLLPGVYVYRVVQDGRLVAAGRFVRVGGVE